MFFLSEKLGRERDQDPNRKTVKRRVKWRSTVQCGHVHTWKQPRTAIYCDVRQENKHDKHETKAFKDKLELTDLF